MPRLIRSRWTIAAAVAAAAALALTACTAPGSSTPGPTSSSVSGDVHFQLYQQPSSFNPFTAINAGDGSIAGLQYRPLMLLSGSKYVPVLAKSWESNADGTVWTFHLAASKWSDGAAFTADDVIYSYEAYTNPATKSNLAATLSGVKGAADFIAGTAAHISGLTAPDEHTVKIALTKPNASFVGALINLFIVPKHVFGSIDPATFTGNQLFREPAVGIGPYVFSKWVNDDEIEFVPNKKSLEKHPLAHIYAQYMAGDTAEAQLQTGEMDIAQVAASDVATLKGDSSLNIIEATGINVMSLWSALDNGLLANAKVRQAILYAIDRKSIVKNVLAGHATVPQTMIFEPSWAVPKDLTSYDYNPEKAKQLLAEAGWNSSTPVDLDIVPGQSDRDATMNIVAGELKAVGINASVKQLQPAQVSALLTTNRKEFDLMITILAVNPADPGATINDRYTTTGGLNISKYSNSKVDELATQGMATTDQAKRQEIYQQINKILNADVPSIPLFVEQSIWGLTKRVSGFDPDTAMPLRMAQNWTVSN